MTEQDRLLPEALVEDALSLSAAVSVTGMTWERRPPVTSGALPVGLGLLCTILYCPRSHLCLTIHPSGVQESTCFHFVEILCLEGADSRVAKGKGPCAQQNGCWAGSPAPRPLPLPSWRGSSPGFVHHNCFAKRRKRESRRA